MTRTVRAVPNILRSAQQYLFYRDEEARAKRAKEAAVAVPGQKGANVIKDYVMAHGHKDGDHFEWYFDQPLTIGDAEYLGFRNVATTSTFIDTDKADELIARKGLEEQVTKTYTDYNELYNLHQQGLVSEEEIDALMVSETKYSLTVIK